MAQSIDHTTVRDALIAAVSHELRLRPTDIETDVALTEYGIESVTALAVAVEIEDELGLTGLDPTLLWDHPTIDALATKVAELAQSTEPVRGLRHLQHAQAEVIEP